VSDLRSELDLIIKKHRDAVENSFSPVQINQLAQIAREFTRCLKAGHKLLFCGNGGSAADSQHIAAEFVGRFKINRPGLPALALTTDTSILTAVANDFGYDTIFSRQVEALGNNGDILIGLSTSGMSASVLQAVSKASEKGLTTIGFCGIRGGDLKKTADISFVAQHEETSHVQEIHMVALHAISEVVEKTFFG